MTDTQSNPNGPAEAADESVPWWIVFMNMGYLIILGLLALWWGQSPQLRSHFPVTGTGVPVEVLWWGTGCGHGEPRSDDQVPLDRDPSLNVWHIARPFTGAVLGGVSYLIYVLVIATAGAT